MSAATSQRQLAFLRQNTALLLAIAVGGLGGLWLGERASQPAADRWLPEVIVSMRHGDWARARFVLDSRLEWEPGDVAAGLLRAQVARELGCQGAMAEGEHALANGDRGGATVAFEGVGDGCRQRPYAVTRLEQIGAR